MKKQPKKAKGRTAAGGRYTKALAARICEAIAAGESMRKAAAENGVPNPTVMRWVRSRPAFAEQYARACETRLGVQEEKLFDLMAQGHLAAMDPECGNARLQAVKLEIDTLKWMLSKLLPKKYGEASRLELDGKVDGPALPARTDEELGRFAAMLAAANACTPPPGEEDCSHG